MNSLHRSAGHAPARILGAAAIATAIVCAPGKAEAVVKGTTSSLGASVVRMATRGGAMCSAVAIGRALVVTAGHCGAGGVRAGAVIGVARVSKSAILDDGRRVSVSGDANILTLSSPLPGHVVPLPVGPGDGESFTIAGYGTTQERPRGASGTLHEARLVPAGPYALVDPNREGSIGASACFGDSGGAVLRGSMLVGIITRAAHPSPRIACGHLTRWAPIVASGEPAAIAATTGLSMDNGQAIEAPRKVKRMRSARKTCRSHVSDQPWRP